MSAAERIARCEREIQKCQEAAELATTAADRYGLTWAEVDWMVAKQLYQEQLAAVGQQPSLHECSEEKDGYCVSS